MIKRLGVDIDGVVARFSENFCEEMSKITGKLVLSKDKNLYNKEYMEYADSKTEKCFNLPPYEDSLQVLNRIKDNTEVTFITKRGINNPEKIKAEIKHITWQFLDKHFPFYQDCYFMEDKWILAKQKYIQLMVEDEVSNARKISKFCPVLLMTRPWNRGFKLNSNIIPIDSWYEAEYYINKLK